MTEAQIADILARVKVNIGIKSTTAYDERLTQLINAAHEEIIASGASTLDASNNRDCEIITVYATWLWNGRSKGDKCYPMVRALLDKRVLGEKARING